MCLLVEIKDIVLFFIMYVDDIVLFWYIVLFIVKYFWVEVKSLLEKNLKLLF